MVKINSLCNCICGIFLPLNPSATIYSSYARSAFYPQSAVLIICILHPACILLSVYSLHCTPGPQSAVHNFLRFLAPSTGIRTFLNLQLFLSRYSFCPLESSESGALSIQQKFQFEILETSDMLSGTVGSSCTDLTQATVHFVIVVSQQTQNYTLKEKSKYCFNPKEHWKTGKLKEEESYFSVYSNNSKQFLELCSK